MNATIGVLPIGHAQDDKEFGAVNKWSCLAAEI